MFSVYLRMNNEELLEQKKHLQTEIEKNDFQYMIKRLQIVNEILDSRKAA